MYYRKRGEIVEFKFRTTATIANDVSTTVFTFPAGYRPLNDSVSYAAGAGTYGDRPASGRVNTDGTVVIRNQYSGALVVQGAGMFSVT